MRKTKQNKTDVWDWKRDGIAGESRGVHTHTHRRVLGKTEG